MGSNRVDRITKGYREIAIVPASEMRRLDPTKIPPALRGLLEAFNESDDARGVTTEIVVRISGREDRIYSVVLNEAQQIQELLQWGIVADED